jgi:hypothetical protein
VFRGEVERNIKDRTQVGLELGRSRVSHVIDKQPIRVEVVVVLKIEVHILTQELTHSCVSQGKEKE